jgi:hypothetical protein
LPTRRFPPPWSVEEQAASFVVRDHSGQQIAYVYFEDEPGRKSVFRRSRALFLTASIWCGANQLPPLFTRP